MRIAKYIGIRLLYIIPVMLGVTILVFLISHTIPGDPASLIAGPKASKATIERIRHDLGLDKPIYVQYMIYLRGLLKGDFGKSIRTGIDVATDLKKYFPATLELTFFSMLFAIGAGIPLGIISAIKRNRWPDHISRTFSIFGVSMPVFWLGLLLLLVFYSKLKVLPGSGRLDTILSPPTHITGMYTIDALLTGNWPVFISALTHLILPAFCLGYVYLAIITRITRSSMLEVLNKEYIETARANGIPERSIILKHALKNALIPVVTIIGISFGELMGGAILTETIFSFPGVGKYVVESINYLDFPAIMGFTVVVTFIYVFMNLLVDIIYAFLDPQIRY